MFNYLDDSEALFEILDKNLNSSIQLNNNQSFIVDKLNFYLIVFQKSENEQKFIGFEIIKGTDFRKNANLLLSHLQDELAAGKTELEPAVEELSEYLMGLYPNHLFFDAH